MKVAASAVKQVELQNKTPLLPLVPDKTIENLNKDNSVTYNLRTNPGDANSPTYKATIRVLEGSESVRLILQWKRDALRVVEGLNITTIDNKIRIVTTLMKGSPRNIFISSINYDAQLRMDEALKAAQALPALNGDSAETRRAAAVAAVNGHGRDYYRHNDDFLVALNRVVENLIPKKTLAQVKRYLRRECRKPAGMKIRTYWQHLARIDHEELRQLPPFGPNQGFQQDEWNEIIQYAVPKSWIKEMDRQGFDPWGKTTEELVDFLERIETAEDFNPDKVNKSNNNKDSKNGSPNKKPYKGDGSLYCMVHGKGNHKTEDCTTIKRMANKNKESPNKSWNRKAEEAKKKSKKELNAIIEEAVDKKLAEVNSVENKRKSDDDSSDDNGNDANMLEDEMFALDLLETEDGEIEEDFTDEYSV